MGSKEPEEYKEPNLAHNSSLVESDSSLVEGDSEDWGYDEEIDSSLVLPNIQNSPTTVEEADKIIGSIIVGRQEESNIGNLNNDELGKISKYCSKLRGTIKVLNAFRLPEIRPIVEGLSEQNKEFLSKFEKNLSEFTTKKPSANEFDMSTTNNSSCNEFDMFTSYCEKVFNAINHTIKINDIRQKVIQNTEINYNEIVQLIAKRYLEDPKQEGADPQQKNFGACQKFFLMADDMECKVKFLKYIVQDKNKEKYQEFFTKIEKKCMDNNIIGTEDNLYYDFKEMVFDSLLTSLDENTFGVKVYNKKSNHTQENSISSEDQKSPSPNLNNLFGQRRWLTSLYYEDKPHMQTNKDREKGCFKSKTEIYKEIKKELDDVILLKLLYNLLEE